MILNSRFVSEEYLVDYLFVEAKVNMPSDGRLPWKKLERSLGNSSSVSPCSLTDGKQSMEPNQPRRMSKVLFEFPRSLIGRLPECLSVL